MRDECVSPKPTTFPFRSEIVLLKSIGNDKFYDILDLWLAPGWEAAISKKIIQWLTGGSSSSPDSASSTSL
ncbi:uncharacterized protein CPUR_06750 [Claviceps purpurea 20.1]|uniref:Uncharacterized protein n=1 Tax=Claviceps purpurea (strain 20.1) TaxID=1111077 RepID=M1WHK4_CLAP2|nr:uncharacterized protein CPUR_06750 [Claviceps purpurea 20.1]